MFFIGGIAAIILLLNNRLERLKNISLSLALAGFVISIFIMLDGAISLFSQERKKEFKSMNLIFEANSVAGYKTMEFEFLAKINSIGLRNKEISIEKGNKFRILCIGDSWTYGWGVSNEDTWPQQLEVFLKNAGFRNAEVINCGESGTYPGAYESILMKLCPLLKPDLVIVGLLQIDDLAQCFEMSKDTLEQQIKNKRPILSGISKSLKLFYRISFENLLQLLKSNNNKVYNVKAEWKTTSEGILNNLNHLQKKRFETLDDTVKLHFRSGNLNPGLLYYYLYFPDRFYIFNDPSHKATRIAIALMKKNLEKIKTTCRENNADLVIANLPEAAFTGHKTLNITNMLQNDYLFNHNHIDSIYSSIAYDLNISYFQLTERFKTLNGNGGYFYYYDGHPSVKGYKEISTAIGEFLIRENHIE